MPQARRGGGIAKRCECRSPGGRRLGKECPELSKQKHGTYQLQQEVPAKPDGTRRIFRRTGYKKVTDAQADLDKVRAVLALVDEDDPHRGYQIGDLLMSVSRDREPIPDAAEVKRRLAGGVALDSDMLLGEWLDAWVAAKKTKRRTTSSYESHIRVHLKPGLGRFRLDRLTVGHVQSFFDAIDDQNEVARAENQVRREQEARCRWRPGTKGGRPSEDVSKHLAAEREKLAALPPYRKITGPATKQRIRATLRAALNGAIRKQLLTFNPAEWVELESGKRPKAKLWTQQHIAHWERTGEKPSPVMVWTPDQLGVFLDAAETSRLYAFFHLIAFRGLRRGEGVGQPWVYVDLDAGLITPAKTLIVDNWQVYEDDPKTEESASTIALDSLNVAVLREHRARQLVEREDWNRHAATERAKGKDVADWTDTGKVFTDVDGTWLHPEKVSDEFRRIYKRAGLPPINLRDLRHLAATLVHAGGGDIFAVQKTLRHASGQLTSDTYTELLEEVDRDIAEKAAGLVPRARRSPENEPPVKLADGEGGTDGDESKESE
ncbi:tyrosine-type recombinase/integrase [Streptomyces sp. ND04-05B]|uniref:site-specific integrase n=1 Tax=Streptomyces sp. ND04-05B TaxID=3028693 RepID=UPI0029BBB206|nr:tyrosine-type recombinase/integrase [Streptomyces sp. ND04-05B]MDX3067095.1 tyrosine-type recombinase/integrase [Streptomyces sp. ND04-05B]